MLKLNLLDCRTHLDDELYDRLSPAMRDELNLILASIKVPTARPQAEIDKLLAEEDGLTPAGCTQAIELEWALHTYHHKLWSICCYFTNPAHRARAEHDSEYWQNFYVGGVHIPGVKTPVPTWLKDNRVAEGILIRNARLVDETKA